MCCGPFKHPRSPNPPFIPALPLAKPFLPPRNTAARALNAEAGWREKQANLTRQWSTYQDPTEPTKEVHEARGWDKDKGVIKRGAVDVPLLGKAPATGEQARQWKARTRGMRYELDVAP